MIWTDFFKQPLESHGAAWSREVESNARQMILNSRRSSLHQYELESYAALGKKLSAALQDISIFEANARPGHPVVVEVSVLEWAAEPLFSWVEK